MLRFTSLSDRAPVTGLTLSALALSCLALSCLQPPDDPGKDTGGSTGDSGDPLDTSDSGADTPFSASIQGDITVELYQTGEDGERETLSWDEATGGEWVFGGIFVAAYRIDEDGKNHYVAESVLTDPSTDTNPYSLDIAMEGPDDVYVYAVLDYYGNNIVGSSEPKGVWPDEIAVADGDVIEDIDISILSMVPSGGPCSSGTLNISGDYEITEAWAGGNVATMLVTTEGEGPYSGHGSWTEPTATATGAEGSHAFATCQQLGDMKVVAAWDTNGNGMADPDDTWGAHVSEPDVDGNPITLAGEDLSGIDVQIPFGDGPGVNVVPFVTISGAVSVGGGAFDDLPSGTSLYVVAMKYRPSGDIDATTLASAYDSETWSWADLTGETSKDYSLIVPATTIVYLWALADTDGDGILNENGEYVASGGADSNGRLSTGTTSHTTQDLFLATATEAE